MWSPFHQSTDSAETVAATASADNRIQVFGISAANDVYRTAQTVPLGAWSKWESLRGHKLRTMAPASSDRLGRLVLFGTGLDDRIWRAIEVTGGDDPTWTWVQVGAADDRLHTISVARDANGFLHVFGTAADETIWHARCAGACCARPCVRQPAAEEVEAAEVAAGTRSSR